MEIKLTGYKDIPDQISEYDKADFNWYKIGKLESSNELTIKTEGGAVTGQSTKLRGMP